MFLKTLVTIILFAANIVSIILLYHHIGIEIGDKGVESLCDFSQMFDCKAVAGSQYSEIFGFPVAALSLMFFSGWLLLKLMLSSVLPERIARFEASASLYALLASVVMFSLSYWVIKAWCFYCIIIYVLSAFLFFINSIPALKQNKMSILLDAPREVFLIAKEGFFSKSSNPKLATSSVSLIVLAVIISYLPIVLESQMYPKLTETETINLALEEWQRASKNEIKILHSENLAETDFYLGTPGALVDIVVFSDFECPHCKVAAHLLERLVREFPEHVSVTYKNFPLDESCNPAVTRPLHKFSCLASVYARCAGMQSPALFWKMHDVLFEDQEFSGRDMENVVLESGVFVPEFNQCIKSGEVLERVRQDAIEGQGLSLTSTPSIFINGKIIKTRIYNELREVVKKIISGESL